MTRVAGIDCGTNTIRLLIADRGPRGELSDVLRRAEFVRLGEGVDRTGRLAEAAIARALVRCREYAAQCREFDCAAVRFVATSATRDAANRDDFLDRAADAFAAYGFVVKPEVVSGDQEAELTFAGATAELRSAGMPGPFLVIDLGGGSTEFVRGRGVVEAALSVDVGSVRLTERCLRSDPPSPADLARARAIVDAALDRVAMAVSFAGLGTVVGVAGTVTTLTAYALGLPAYDSDQVHLATLPVEEVVGACTRLLALSRAERAALAVVEPGRVDVICAGALIWRTVLKRLASVGGARSVTTSEKDILDGITATARPPGRR